MNNPKTACFTGHRPNKLNGYNPRDNDDLLFKLRDTIIDYIENKYQTVKSEELNTKI